VTTGSQRGAGHGGGKSGRRCRGNAPSLSPCHPRISVVTASYNQGAFIGRTIDSVLAQDYPNLEHIVVDGVSTDDTQRVLARYRHLRVVREPDRGQADAINKGFRAATGDILCFLNSDDTLQPGALERVAREIDPGRGRHVVMGRCRFIDRDDHFAGLEHPSAFESHRRVLEVWKGHCLPQPAVFWTRAVWERCGPLDVGQQLVLDYDFFCRVSRHYRFHVIDQVLANYRLHAQSKTCSADGREVLEDSIRISRRYWSGLDPWQRFRIYCAYAWFRLGRRRRALDLLRVAVRAGRARRWFAAGARVAACAAFAPDVLAHAVLLPAVARHSPIWFERLRWLDRLCRPRTAHPNIAVWRQFVRVHDDGWAGPVCRLPIRVGPGADHIELEGGIEIGHLPEPLEITFMVDGRPLGRHRVGRRTPFRAVLPLTGVAPGEHELQLLSNTYLVADDFRANADYRPLSFKLHQLKLTG
jgi:glycosyltransferase involved in cell wall biosynthesis